MELQTPSIWPLMAAGAFGVNLETNEFDHAVWLQKFFAITLTFWVDGGVPI